MKPVRYGRSTITSKIGVDHVELVVDSAGCVFHRISQENDLGVDGIIEIVRDGFPEHKQIAVQVKSGQSYFNAQTDQCSIPVGNHFEYWTKHPLPVFGIVYIPSLKSASWTNVKDYLGRHGCCSTIRFKRTRVNVFDSVGFSKVFIPAMLGETPGLSFEEAGSFLHSGDPSERLLGLVTLFRRYPNNDKTWDTLVGLLTSSEPADIPPILIYYLAHIPWHGDTASTGETLTEMTKKHARVLLESMGIRDVVKLLQFIDEENGIARGTMGQHVEAIISSLRNRDRFLTEIIEDASLPRFLKECAALIFAYHHGRESLPRLEALASQGSWYAGELYRYVSKLGSINPYA